MGLKATAFAAGFVLVASAASATSLNGAQVQVNVVPAGYYKGSSASVVDGGAGNVMVFWSQDTISDIPNNTGNTIRSRGFSLTPTTFTEVKPAALASQPASTALTPMLGTHVTTNGDMHLFWASTNGTTTTIFRQIYRAGNKLGAITTLVPSFAGSSPRYVGGRTDKTAALIWRAPSAALKNAGRIISPTGALTTTIGFNLGTGESLVRTTGVGTSFAATTAVYDATFDKRTTYGRSFTGAFALQTPRPTLNPLADFTVNPFSQIAARSDGKVVFFNGLLDTGGKVDMSGRVYSAAWSLPGALVPVSPNTPGDTNAGPLSAPLPAGELLTAHQLTDGAGQSIYIRRLSAALAPVGVTAKIGPTPNLRLANLTVLSTGKAVVAYYIGEKLYIRQVTP
jgi:hypothetical protein